MWYFNINGQKVKSICNQVLKADLQNGKLLCNIIWKHKWDGGETQCAEMLTPEEIGQIMGGN